MGTQTVKYDIAKALDDLSFDEYCHAYIEPDEKIHISYGCNSIWRSFGRVAAPTIQQVVEWFEDKYGLEIITKSWKDGSDIIYLYSVNKLGSTSSYRLGEFTSKTRMEAIEKCIWDAIKLVKK
jgi:hypothetical protein